MFKVGDTVKIKHDGSIGAVVGVNTIGGTTQYVIIVNGRKMTFFEEQLSGFDIPGENTIYSAKELNALLTARLIINRALARYTRLIQQK